MNTPAFNLHDRHELFAQIRDLAVTITRDPVAARSVASRTLRDFNRERSAPEAWLIHHVGELCLAYLEVGPHPDDKRDPEVAGVTDDDWSFFDFMYGDEADEDEEDEDDSLEDDNFNEAA